MGTRLSPNTYGILLACVSLPDQITDGNGGLRLGTAANLFKDIKWDVLKDKKVDVPAFLAACKTVKQVALDIECNNPPCIAKTIVQITVTNAMAMMKLFPDINKKLDLTRRAANKKSPVKKKKP